jgi:hypothetical protein
MINAAAMQRMHVGSEIRNRGIDTYLGSETILVTAGKEVPCSGIRNKIYAEPAAAPFALIWVKVLKSDDEVPPLFQTRESGMEP